MPILYLVIDHSHLAPWVNTSIAESGKLLADYKIVLASPLKGKIPRWSEYWHMAAHDPENPQFKALLENIHKSLDNGQDVFLPGAYFDFDVTRRYLDRIKEEYGAKGKIKAIFVFEKPALMLDWWWQRTPGQLQNHLANSYIFNSTHISLLLKIIEQALGKDNLQYIFNERAELNADLVKQQLKKIFQAANITAEPIVSQPFHHPDWLLNNNEKTFIESLSVRQNSWPFLDEDKIYEDIFHKLENRSWLPGLSWNLRKRYLASEKQDRASIATLTGISEDRLAPPELFILEKDFMLEKKNIKKVFLSFPVSIQSAIFTRLSNDSMLLDKFQTNLLDAMRESGNFKSLSMPPEIPRLTVLTLAYNHEKYIAECMESVLAQKTDFPVRHIVLDNYSTDSTPEIIKQFASSHPSIVPVLLKGDVHVYNGVIELFNRARTEYVSICEGDDYFTDSEKLQKQVAFLEENRDCALSFHPVLVKFEDHSQPDFLYPPANSISHDSTHKFPIESLFQGNIIQTNSVVYRWRFRDGLPDWFDASLCPADWYWHLLHAETGLIGFLPDIMSVYRRHANALYKHAFKDRLEHRKSAGMNELRTFAKVDSHFKGKWNKRLCELAAGVFSDFLRAYIEENDDSLLKEACEKYPQFAKDFLNRINIGKI